MHRPGMIALPCSDNARYSDIIPTIMGLERPPGTVFMKAGGLGPARPLNTIAAEFLRRPGLEWLLTLNDDNLPPSDALIRLLDWRVDVVTGLYLGKMQPFEPILFDYTLPKEGQGMHHRFELGNEYRVPDRRGLHEGRGPLIPITACGDGCLLIRRKVLEMIPHPRWQYGVGTATTDNCDHDMVFSRKVREAGFGLWCDTSVWVGHIGIMAVYPHRNPDGKWEVHLCQGDRKIVMPVV